MLPVEVLLRCFWANVSMSVTADWHRAYHAKAVSSGALSIRSTTGYFMHRTVSLFSQISSASIS